MAKRSTQAVYLSELLSQRAATPIRVAWESSGAGVARGNWWVRWTDGPCVTTLRTQAGDLARWVRPLDVDTLRYGRSYSPHAWALALHTVATGQDGIPDWHDLLGLAEIWLHEADLGRSTPQADATAADLVRRSEGSEYQMARLLADAHQRDLTKPRDEKARCEVCGGHVVQAPVGRPARYCSPACRTRAWRARAASVTKPRDEKARCEVCGGHVVRAAVGRPARHCSPACRQAAFRHRHA